MATVSKLTVNLGLASASLINGLSNVQKKINRFQQKANRQFQQVNASIVESMQGAFASIGGSLTSVHQSFAEVAKEAKNSRIAISEFSGIASVFELAGASASDATGLISHMRDAIADASTGSGTYAEQFKKIGVSVSDLQGLNPTEQFTLIATSVNKLSTAYERNLAFSDLLGGGQEKIGLILGKYGGDITKLIQKTKELGIAYQDNLIVAHGELSSSFTNLRKSMANVIGNAFLNLTNAVTKVNNYIVAFNATFPNLSKSIAKATLIIGGLVIGLAGLSLIKVVLTPAVLLLKSAFLGLFSASIILTKGIAKLFLVFATNPFVLMIASVGALIFTFYKFRKNIFKIWESVVSTLKIKWDVLVEDIKDIWGGITSFFSKVVDEVKKKWNNFTTFLSDLAGKAFDKLPNWMKTAINKIGGIAKEGIKPLANGLSVIKEKGAGALDVISQKTDKAKEKIKEYGTGIYDASKNGFQNASDIGKQGIDFLINKYKGASDIVSNFFSNIKEKGLSIKEAFEQLFLSPEIMKKIQELNQVTKDVNTINKNQNKKEDKEKNKKGGDIRTTFSDNVAQGIVSGLQSGGVKGALEGFANSLKSNAEQELISGLSKALSESLGNNVIDFFGNLFSGSILGFNDGGIVKGNGIGNRDTVPAMLTAGEIVINPKKTSLDSLGSHNYITYNINAIDSKSFEEMLNENSNFLYRITEEQRQNNTTLRD